MALKNTRRAAIMAAGAASFAIAAPSRAAVTQIVIDSSAPAFGGASVGNAGPYTLLTGRAFGSLDPANPHNQIIQDIGLAPKNNNGNATYIATFQIAMIRSRRRAPNRWRHTTPVYP